MGANNSSPKKILKVKVVETNNNSTSASQIVSSYSPEPVQKVAKPLNLNNIKPDYYNLQPVKSKNLDSVIATWNCVIDGLSPVYIQQKILLGDITCSQWFENTFYEHLFDLDPVSTFLISFINLLIFAYFFSDIKKYISFKK